MKQSWVRVRHAVRVVLGRDHRQLFGAVAVFVEIALRDPPEEPGKAALVILGGIFSDIFTPTEAALVATVYALLVGGLVYRTLTLRGPYEALCDAAASSAVVMLVVPMPASSAGW